VSAARILVALFFSCGIFLGVAQMPYRTPDWTPTPKPIAAPELDLSALRGGFTLMAGGLLVLHERRRKK